MITQLNHVKYLGILIDSTLSWKPHVSELSKNLQETVKYVIKSDILKAGTLKLLYYSLFYSFLSYGVTVRVLTHPSTTKSLYKLQKKVICAICFEDMYVHTTPLFHKLKTLKLYDIHSLKLLCFVYDCTKDQPITYFDNFFTLVHLVHQHFTRQASEGNLTCSDILLIQPNIESDLPSILEPFCGIIFQCILINDSSSKVIFKKESHKMFIELLF